MNETFDIVKRKRGNILLHGGYQYYRQKTYKNDTTIWHCSRKRSLKCHGSITEKGKILKTVAHDTNCVPDESKNKVALIINEAKEEAATSDEPMPKIFKKHIDPLLNAGIDFVTKVPTFQNTKCLLYNKRKQTLQVHKLVYNDIRDVEVPATFQTFMLADYNTEQRRILIFSSKNELLATINEYFIDATFKSTPKPFYQLLVIHGDVGSTTVTTKVAPLFFALMSDKTEESYRILFDLIKKKASQWNPEKVHVDFEIAPTNALKSMFPNINIKRCFFHYKQTIFRKYKELNLKGKIYRKIVELCSVLPLLPNDEITEGYMVIKLKSLMLENQKIDKFMQYMENYFFKSEEFVMEWTIAHERHRTNNVCEGWNSKLNKLINKNYNPILKFLTVLKQISYENIEENQRGNLQKKTDEVILQAQMALVNNEMDVGGFLNELR